MEHTKDAILPPSWQDNCRTKTSFINNLKIVAHVVTAKQSQVCLKRARNFCISICFALQHPEVPSGMTNDSGPCELQLKTSGVECFQALPYQIQCQPRIPGTAHYCSGTYLLVKYVSDHFSSHQTTIFQ